MWVLSRYALLASPRKGPDADVRYRLRGAYARVFRDRALVCPGLRSRRQYKLMSLEFLLSGIAAVLVLAYLVYALLRPERF